MKIFDVHVHIQPWKMVKPSALERLKSARKDGESIAKMMYSPDLFLRYMDEQGVERACIINYVSPEIMGFTHEVNDFSIDYAKADRRRIVPFGSIHPLYTNDVEGDMRRLVEKGIGGVKIHPPHQLFLPNAYRDGLKSLEAIYRVAQESRIPVMIHAGTSVFPGARNTYGDPMPIDDVAVDFPDLKIIIAHGGRPIWMDTAFFLVRRHPNLYMDISGIPPVRLLDYFPRLEKIADKVLFGTDWPHTEVPSIKGNIDEFLSLPLKNEIKEDILSRNALKIFSL